MADDAAAALLRQQSAARAALTDEVRRRVGIVWATFDAPYDPEAVAALSASLAATVRAGQVNISALTDAYMARLISMVDGRPVNPAGDTVPADLRGIDPNVVYTRPAEQYRWLVSQGTPPDEAQRIAGIRVDALAFMDMVLAARWSSFNTMKAKGVHDWRRVPSGHRVCGLCLAASHRVYHISNLMPIHQWCSCEVVPLGQDEDRVISDEQLQDLYDAAGGNSARDLAQTRYAVSHHGEYGPVLRQVGHAFRGPNDIP